MRNSRWTYDLLHLVLFLGLWAAAAWMLLSNFQWSSSLYSALAAIAAGYIAAGSLLVAPVLFAWLRSAVTLRRQNPHGLLVREHPVRVFIPAEVLRLHQHPRG